MATWCSVALAALTIVFAWPSAMAAQDLLAAERALARGRNDEAIRIVEALLEEGTREGDALAPLYRVLGLARVANGDEEEARTALARWVGLDPTARVDDVNEDARSLFMEARGVWAGTSLPLGARAELAEDLSGIVVRVTDPANMAARVRTRFRVAGGSWVSSVVPPAPVIEVPVPGLAGARRVEYHLAFIDEYGNRVWLDGSDEAPRVLERAVEVAVVEGGVAAVEPSPAPDTTPFIVAGSVLLATAVGLAIGGGFAHAERERSAGLYNGDGSGCTGTGTTRGTLCGPESTAVSANETAASILYSVGGAALLGGIAAFALMPASSREPGGDASFACAPGLLAVTCGGTF